MKYQALFSKSTPFYLNLFSNHTFEKCYPSDLGSHNMPNAPNIPAIQ